MNDWMWLTGVVCGLVGFAAAVVVVILDHREQTRFHRDFQREWGGVR